MDERRLPLPPAAPGSSPFPSVASAQTPPPQSLQTRAAVRGRPPPPRSPHRGFAVLSATQQSPETPLSLFIMELPYTTSKQAPEWGQAGEISKQVLWFVTVSREKTKNSKRWRKESDVLNRPVGDTTQQKLMMIYDFQVYNITIQYLSKLQNDYYKGTYHLSPYTAVFSWDEELLRSTLLVTFKYVIQCY